MAGCGAIDRPAMTEFEPLAGDRFNYEAIADVVYPVASDAAENIRMDWLRAWLSDNKTCPAGFEIVERKVVLVRGALANTHRIFYRGRCKRGDHSRDPTHR